MRLIKRFPVLFLVLYFSVSAAQERKNILLLMADDFNHWARSIGYYGQSVTPNIDRLAGMGVLFTEAHCSSPVCNPSRNAFLSGYRPSTTGISTNGDGFVREKAGFENIVTLNQYFKEQGYYVYGAGKIWHPARMNPSNPECDPANWTELNTRGSGCQGGSHSHFEATSGTEFVWGGNPDPMTEANCNDLALANDVAGLLQGYATSSRSGQPFFIACGFFRPHLPWNSPKEFWDLYGEDTLTIPKGYLEGDLSDIPGAGTAGIFTELVQKDKWIEGIHAYLASVSLADYNVGVVLDALENSGYLDHTIVVFMGDHGWHLGEKDRWAKYAVYDQANHTTMIIFDPDAEGDGKVCRKVVSMQDIYPTLVDLAGVDPKTGIEGRSLAPLLNDPGRTDWDHPVMMTYAGTNIIKTNRYRFVDKGTESQLYHVATDPYEWENLYGEPGTQAVVDHLKIKMDSMIRIGLEMRKKLLDGYSFNPEPLSIPGTIEAEDYDEGSGSQTYKDSDSINSGGQYRNDGVDIVVTDDPSGGGFKVTSTENGEWLRYSVADYEPGTYEISGRMKYSGNGSAIVHFYLDDRKVGQVVLNMLNTGWSDYLLPEVEINSFGALHFRVEIEGYGAELNSFTFTRTDRVSGNLEIRDDGSKGLLVSNRMENQLLQLDLSGMNPLARLEIFSVKGERLEEGYVPGEIRCTYPVKQRLKKGVYILRITDGENDRAERFMVD